MRPQVLLAALVIVYFATAAPTQNAVRNVPGFDEALPFNMYAGYMPVNDSQKMLFYMFAESQRDPVNDPVVLWLNGGPGCSSFDGFIYEHGPFYFESGAMGPKQKLKLNPNSWNMVANVIYLDSPCGVGLSYSPNPQDYITDDKTTAKDSHSFLLNFFDEYPEFKGNKFFIAGESYAGIYVPTLAQQVAMGNSNPNTFINLAGILVGNGVTDDQFDGNAYVPFAYGHGLINIGLYNQLEAACGGQYWNATGNCLNLLNQAAELTQDINIYNIYLPCDGSSGSSSSRKAKEPIHDVWYRVKQPLRDAVAQQELSQGVGGIVPCIDSTRAHDYMNQDTVRVAFHAIPVDQKEWFICFQNLSYTNVYSTVIPIYQYLIQGGYRILVYSGDTDMCVPYVGSESWTRSLGLPVKQEWSPWMVNNQVAGYVKYYDANGHDFTFATIKGSGHTVPQYKPPQAFHMFMKFLAGSPF